jgi:rhamnosyltransferase
VLLATYNGERWIEEQLESIRNQISVKVNLIVSDDSSNDNTISLIKKNFDNVTILDSEGIRYCSANRNFLRIVRDANIGDADFVALSDQDDVWVPEKLITAINVLKKNNADAYSSDVMAFWENGKSKYIKKSHIQKKYDHLFGSPGPGCTFVFTREIFMHLQIWVTNNFDRLVKLWVHDWIFYAFVRSMNRKWLIHTFNSIYYRQHKSNEIGANWGISAMRMRLSSDNLDRFRRNIIEICTITCSGSQFIPALNRLYFIDRCFLALNSYNFRRSIKDVFALAIIFFLIKRPKI